MNSTTTSTNHFGYSMKSSRVKLIFYVSLVYIRNIRMIVIESNLEDTES